MPALEAAKVAAGQVPADKLAETQTLIFNNRLDAAVCLVFALMVIVLAAAEAAVALAIILNFYNNHATVDVDKADELKG